MKSILLTITTLLMAGLANANDGSTPFLDVRGVHPQNIEVETNWDQNYEVTVYGKNTKVLFDVLPYDFVIAEESRSVSFASKAYTATIGCSKHYNHPLTGNFETDHSCGFSVRSNSLLPNYKSPYFNGDDYGDYYVLEQNGFPGTIDSNILDVRGINPNKTPEGVLFSIYGNDTDLFREAVNSDFNGLDLTSKAYTVNISCSDVYTHPNTGVVETDGKCDFSLYKNK